MSNKPVMGLGSVSFFTLSTVILIDILTANAALGPSAIGWWIVTIVVFIIPYALIVSELGTRFPGDGGIYDWIKHAFGDKAGARTTFYYWINIGLWMPAVYILFAGTASELFWPEMSLTLQVFIGIVMSWLTVVTCNARVTVGLFLTQIGSLIKIGIILVIGTAGILHGINNGFATEFTFTSMMPHLSDGVEFLPALVISMLGLELVASMVRELRNPKHDLPIATIFSSLLIASLYIYATVGLLAIISADDLGLVDGLVSAFTTIFGNEGLGRVAVVILSLLAMFSFVSNMVTWTMGSSRSAQAAAREGELPRWVGYSHPEHDSPIGANVVTGTVSTVVLVVYGLTSSESDELFWTMFSFSSCIFLLPYLMLFAAYVKLKDNSHMEDEVFALPNYAFFRYCFPFACFFSVSIALTLFVFPQIFTSGIDWSESGPVAIGIMVTIIAGELAIHHSLKKRETVSAEPSS